ncbi:MAG: hypothetical protein ACK5KN_11165 [Dysgonomonas sp.]|uniref:hypothetical protein n=1 Tax=Dysgonomonas sp. TaxID=1891233 RepID=UPI003A8B22C9
MEIVLSIIFIIFGILQIILFFKIWGMTNDIRKIKETYLSTINIETSTEDKMNDSSTFRVDALVINIATGKQMRIKEITETGKYSCYTNGGMNHEGDFSESEIKLF